ncbi:uncharacterized protein zgc:112980 isoform X2 [Tachysurus vachellii]|uniref:uncharacterized protein zgc:112980 isoform X2 n=1 Tax=Tachysurus vachellii TaxID=175792 RepID=UPI00296AB339|nr:uncharacterized protein zgc:112980 isoform X2 [Tachysurus vachellii]
MEPEVIVLSDDDDDDAGGDHTGALDNSILIVEDDDSSKEATSETTEILDDDVTITFSRKASVLPHARYDCTVSFSFTDSNISEPENINAAYCEQCFCYICDHPASQCEFWIVPGFYHCNAHKHSVYWKSLRDKRIMGYLHELKFTFNPADMDSELRHAETSLQEFAHSLALKYGTFLMAMANPSRQPACACPCHSTNRRAAEISLANGSAVGCARCYIEHQKFVLYDYTPVMEFIHTFLDDTIKGNPKSSSVLVLGAIKLFITHAAPGTLHALAISHVLLELFWRAMSMVQVFLVDADFPTSFVKQLQDFFQILPLPPDFRKFRNGLNVLPWDDPLLSAVLKGQNITGVRHVKGRRPETLEEELVVVRTRVLKLQQQNRYRELARYLRVVKSDNAAKLQMMRDWVPLYLCKVGDYAGAADSLLSPMYNSSCPASRLSPAQFGAYLRIFMFGHAPNGIPHPPQVEFIPHVQNVHTVQMDPLLSSTWTTIEGGSNLLKSQEVIKFALRVLNCNSAVFTHAESWIKVLKFANQSSCGPEGSCLPEPDYSFLIGYPDQALLLLTTQALAERLLHTRLKPILTVILTFKSNPWVMRWLFSSLMVKPQMLQDLFHVTLEELLDVQSRSVLRIQDTAEQFFIASFLCLFFLEPSVLLHPNTYPITDLLAQWNEFDNPWQFHLRRMLEANGSSLSVEKQQILMQMNQWGLHQ